MFGVVCVGPCVCDINCVFVYGCLFACVCAIALLLNFLVGWLSARLFG